MNIMLSIHFYLSQHLASPLTELTFSSFPLFLASSLPFLLPKEENDKTEHCAAWRLGQGFNILDASQFVGFSRFSQQMDHRALSTILGTEYYVVKYLQCSQPPMLSCSQLRRIPVL